MRLFTPIAFKVALILFVHNSDGFMFSNWLRGTTEKTLPTLGQYKQQSYPNNEAQIVATGVAPANIYESKKDSGKPNVDPIVTSPAIFNNQRTGISAPPKYDKPWGVFDAVVVHSIPPAVPPTPIRYIAIPAQNYPHFYYSDLAKGAQAATVAPFTSTLPPQKSVHVELNYKDDTVVEKTGENAVLHRKINANPNESSQTTNESSVTTASTTIKFSSPDSVEGQNTSSPVSDSSAKLGLHNRPIKLFGSNTFTPQLYYAPVPVSDVQYVSYPFLKSPPVPPFLYRNVPRAVSDRSEISPVPSPPPAPLPVSNKPAEKPICENCLPPAGFPSYAQPLKIFDTSNHIFQAPCAQDTAPSSPTPASSSFKSSNLANLAYVLVPSQIIKNHST